MKIRHIFLTLFALLVMLGTSCKDDNPVDTGIIQLASCTIGSVQLKYPDISTGIANDADAIISFSSAVDTSSAKTNIILKRPDNTIVPVTYSFAENNSTVIINPVDPLANLTDYKLSIASSLRGSQGETFAGIEYTFTTANGAFVIKTITINSQNFMPPIKGKNVQLNDLKIDIEFSTAPDPTNIKSYFLLAGNAVFDVTIAEGGNIVHLNYPEILSGYTTYYFSVSSELKAKNGYTFNGFSNSFFTALDSSLKFPLISDDELLTLVQRQTFKYFYDYAHPSCGLARERNTSGDVVTMGGSGFGVMALIVGMERGFITRNEGLTRLGKILGFLETCDRFHGAWPHWLNGVTGKVVPFGQNDDGADLVETSFMIQGLLAMRQYLNPATPGENTIIGRINTLANSVEYDWFTQGGQNVLYWNWSPNSGWAVNVKLQGYNETLITYVLAASSTTHSIQAAAYKLGYSRNGAMRNGKTFYGYKLPLGEDYGGPLFFTHYSFLGLNPKNLQDEFANYWEQNVNQSLINQAYCIQNPLKYVGYSSSSWGLTASDNKDGYSAHSPTNDLGVITPTAAISSLPYTPTQSMDAIRHFYYILGDKLWGPYGFYDAFDVTHGWWASSYIAIDQGPQVCMIENYRTSLIWNLFMSAPEVQAGLTKLGFSYK